jgi:Pyridoxal phosphate biosynthesis protein
MPRKPVIALTMGDPAGIGPEIVVRMLAGRPEFSSEAEILVYGCPEVLQDAARRFACPLTHPVVTTGSMRPGDYQFGGLSAACGKEAYRAVCMAAEDALAGKVDAVVTAPVNKAAVNLAGIPFTGHTELIAGICGTDDFAIDAVGRDPACCFCDDAHCLERGFRPCDV